MADRIGRRSRFSKESTGKQVRLNARDLEMFKLLYRYRYLDSDQLTRWTNPVSRKRFIERLGDLFHEKGMLERPEQQKRHHNARFRPIIYGLSKIGYTALQRTSLQLECAVPFAQNASRKIAQFEHAVETSSCLFEIELAVQQHADRRFICQDEIFAKASQKLGGSVQCAEFPVQIDVSRHFPKSTGIQTTTIIPDAIFGIETLTGPKPGYRFYAVEVERTNPLSRKTFEHPSSLKKLITYQNLIVSQSYKRTLGIPNLFAVFASEDRTRLENLINMANDIWTPEQARFLLFCGLGANSDFQFSKHRAQWLDHFGYYDG